MERIYNEIITKHFKSDNEMLFIAGPRQVGKTTVAKIAAALTDNFHYLDWDEQEHRAIILEGSSAVIKIINPEQLTTKKPLVVFDEIHKYKNWKGFLKGFYDTYGEKINIIVSGSAKLDIFKSGGDSLMGRYFLYRIHPLSVAECIRPEVSGTEINEPLPIPTDIWSCLLEYGGFPKPFLKCDQHFSQRWQQSRNQQLFREDIRDASRVHDIARIEILAVLLKHQAGQLTNYSNLARKIRVSVDTISRWIKVLESFYYCFAITPWSKNVTRSLLKEPKIYLWDWSQISDPGARFENFIACHLLKAVHFWNDQGFGEYQLHFIRDLSKQEVDFLVVKNQQPWFLVEAKCSDNTGISKSLRNFQQQTQAQHAFQVVLDKDFVNKDCFTVTSPIIVPAKTFLSQLV